MIIHLIYTDKGSVEPNENESSHLPTNDGNIPQGEYPNGVPQSEQREQICLSFENSKFCHNDLKKITNNFAVEIGKGGSGNVFLGNLKNGQQDVQVAVKKLSGQGDKEFLAEVIIYPISSSPPTFIDIVF